MKWRAGTPSQAGDTANIPLTSPPSVAGAQESFKSYQQFLRNDTVEQVPLARPVLRRSWKDPRNSPLHRYQMRHLPQHHIPIQERHQVSLHEVHRKSFFTLIKGEGFQRLASVVKLSKNHPVVAGHQWTWGVAVILKSWEWVRNTFHHGNTWRPYYLMGNCIFFSFGVCVF